jgi:hypothetical protein
MHCKEVAKPPSCVRDADIAVQAWRLVRAACSLVEMLKG